MDEEVQQQSHFYLKFAEARRKPPTAGKLQYIQHNSWLLQSLPDMVANLNDCTTVMQHYPTWLSLLQVDEVCHYFVGLGQICCPGKVTLAINLAMDVLFNEVSLIAHV